MVAPLRVGVIGVGYLGRFHAEKYAHLKETELVGVADLNEAVAQEVAGALGAEDGSRSASQRRRRRSFSDFFKRLRCRSSLISERIVLGNSRALRNIPTWPFSFTESQESPTTINPFLHPALRSAPPTLSRVIGHNTRNRLRN